MREEEELGRQRSRAGRDGIGAPNRRNSTGRNMEA